MNLLLVAQKIYRRLTTSSFKPSFSQCGEDCIMMFLIHSLKLKDVQYFDIGTNHPCNMNNTYLLYMNNFRGVCLEPDPALHAEIKKRRPGDILIPRGVAVESQTAADFFIMDDSVLNTFSETEANRMVVEHKRIILKKVRVPLISVNELFAQYFDHNKPVIVSLDVEGLDHSILQSIDFEKYKPGIICVETVSYSSNLSGAKDTGISNLLSQNGYTLYADTHINSIFVHNSLTAAASA
ncbi:FkbM family methyltransferase [Mucilaginibacter pedocola]|uniref:Methyltransferase FkbM domain-containing protein n=1 Tax=Mucilaginibacter pedocola TaxID=1792845 RepID=A0A1S9PAX7_9SPHI|nr:FkbM family methyltransferase [Mucilaginibacter pedocola]OOQ58081.1 hypothetical protein BC343_10510 [Mucilaginibacter pedocola]